MVAYEIDGADFSTLDEFYDAISRVVIPDVYWGRNLDAFNDILSGGFGTPQEGFTLRWTNHKLSQERLPQFETLVEIIRGHGSKGSRSESNVTLVLA